MNKILLLEDDISLVDGLSYSLKKNDFDIEIARTVSEALQLLIEISRFDLLILDVTLPDGTGVDVCEKVRKQNIQIPIIFLTASSSRIISLVTIRFALRTRRHNRRYSEFVKSNIFPFKGI